jgi:DNA repair exonuclease SbcCD ATPase subunit
MQRMKRGELSRLKPQVAKHTDVFQPAPTAAASKVEAPAIDEGLAKENRELKEQLKALKAELSGAMSFNEGLQEKLTEVQEGADSPDLSDALKDAEAEAAAAKAELAEFKGQADGVLDQKNEELKELRGQMDEKEKQFEERVSQLKEKLVAANTKEPESEELKSLSVKVDRIRRKDDRIRVDCSIEDPAEGLLVMKENVTLFMAADDAQRLQAKPKAKPKSKAKAKAKPKANARSKKVEEKDAGSDE